MWLGNSTGVKYMYENCAPSDDDEATNRSYIGPTFTQGNRKCRGGLPCKSIRFVYKWRDARTRTGLPDRIT